MQRVNQYALLMYACMFAAIWTGDEWLLPLLEHDGAVVFMRVVSLVIYALFGFVTWALFRWWRRRRFAGSSDRVAGLLFSGQLLRALCIIGITGFVAGFCLLAFGDSSMRFVGFTLTKLVGAPFSIGAVYILGQLPRPTLLHTIALGTFGAFLLFATMEYVTTAVVSDGIFVLVVCVFLFAMSFYCGNRCADIAGIWSKNHIRISSDVIARPKRQVFRPPIVLGILIVSTMLGYARNETASLDASSALAVASIVFLVMVFILFYRGSLPLGFFFQSGVICLAISVLIVPLAAQHVSELQSVLAWAASACLEVVGISLCSWTVHNSRDALMAAVISRTIMVIGHLLGTLLVQAEVAISVSAPDGVTGGSLVLMFAFVLLMLFSYQVPQLQVMLFMVPPKDFDAATENLEEVAERVKTEEIDDAGAEDQDNATETWQDYHQRSCEIVSEVYGLTRREAEVLYLLAQGRTIGYMQEHFVLSQNTLKMHIRHIYQKLDVHSKQEVIDIVGAAQND